MIDSDFTVGFKQGQEHGKQIILEKVNEAMNEMQEQYQIFEKNKCYGHGYGLVVAKQILKKHLGEELVEHE